MRPIFIFAFLLVATTLAVAPAIEAQATSFELLPGVVVDRAGGRIFSMKPGGGVEAVDGRSGRVLFESPLADKPIALWGGFLAAQREARAIPGKLDVVMINTSRPSEANTFELALPADVMALVDETLGRSFSTQSAVRDGSFLVGWSATKNWVSPVQPPAGEKLHDEQKGAARLDLAAGQAYTVEPSEMDDLLPLPEAVVAFAAEPNLFGQPVHTGSFLASTQTTRAGDGSSLVVLKRWRLDGSELPDVELFRGVPIGQWTSADHRHLLISERVAPGQVDEYLWNIYSLETGVRVGQVRNHFSRAYFYVDGNRLIHDVWPFSARVDGKIQEVKRGVQAVDLTSGGILWQRLLRETLYRGPYPP